MATYNEIRNTQQVNPAPPPPNPNQLTAPELAALLQIVKQATFVGEQVEVVYNMVMKLQNQYIEQAKK